MPPDGLPGTSSAIDSIPASDPGRFDQRLFRSRNWIVRIGSTAVERFDDLAMYAVMRPGERVELDVVRDGRTTTVPLTIATVREGDRFGNEYRVGRVGIYPAQRVWAPVSVAQAPIVGIRRTGEIIGMMVDTITQIVTGRRLPVHGLDASAGWYEGILG